MDGILCTAPRDLLRKQTGRVMRKDWKSGEEGVKASRRLSEPHTVRDKRGTRWDGLPLCTEGQHLRPEAESHAHM